MTTQTDRLATALERTAQDRDDLRRRVQYRVTDLIARLQKLDRRLEQNAELFPSDFKVVGDASEIEQMGSEWYAAVSRVELLKYVQGEQQ